MSAIAALRSVGRARLVAGMRVSLASVARPAVARPALFRTSARAFTASAGRFGSGATDIALSQKLQEELKYEQEAAVTEGAAETPEFVKQFLEQGTWSIADTRGHDEVTLARKYGDENIRLMFSIADLSNEEDYDLENESEEEEQPTLPLRASLSITKANGPGALNVDMVSQDGQFIIENVSFYDDAKTGTELTADADWNRRGLYIGPQFDTLDSGLQEEFDKFLQERGINEAVAAFIPEYAAYKEQQEYVKWLGKVKNFIDL
ncbi:mitochondrial glycoprotein [Gymnopilus junonius]|uniref:Mitochondrial glycoprotein n=1 Tax=Gymnopilus junonius TaxID=109634 RepID=A0A9P5NC55_GYMJU|nr:mitochondrial glycoprotein [Gymnopilus junonius]